MNGTKRDIIVWGEYANKRPARTRERQQTAHPFSAFPQQPRGRAGEDAVGRRYRELTTLTVGLIAECRRLRQENDDLRRSAERWVDLYQRQLDRANGLESSTQRAGTTPSGGSPDADQEPAPQVILVPKPDRRNPGR